MLKTVEMLSKVMVIREWITDDGVSYRVTEPEELVKLQQTQWDAIIDKLQQRSVCRDNITTAYAEVKWRGEEYTFTSPQHMQL